MIGQTIAHYRITAKLGEGGMGEVYLATDTKLDRQVALKFLPSTLQKNPEARERLLREARAASKLNHKNILTIYSVESVDGHDFIVMEYVDGRSLRQALDSGEGIPIEQVLRFGLQICDGLGAAHEQGVLHRDIKPANILVTSKGQVKITDFGLATWHGAVQLTKEGTTVGTAAYMAPEQIQGKKVDHRADLFSLGVVFYELIARRRPFAGEHDAAISYAIANEIPEPLQRYKSGVHPGLEQIVARALEKDPSTRYQSANDMLAELKRVRREIEGSQPSMLSKTMPTPPKRKYLKYVVATSAVFVLALLLLVLKPFKLDVVSDQQAAASENSLAVMYFDNIPDPSDSDKHGQMITSLLITDLSESQYLQVVSRQRLYDLLKSLGKQSQTSIDRNTATEIAKRAGVKWILTGEILQSSPKFVITSQVSDASGGQVKSTQRITSEVGEDIFAVVDKLSSAVRADLATSVQARTELDRPVAAVSSTSEEAYKEYLAGVEAFEKFFITEATQHLNRAVELDSTFAMAYAYLAEVERRHGGPSRVWMERALAHVDKAAWNEQHFIRGRAAAESGDITGAIREISKVVERDPADKDAYYMLGVLHRNTGQHDIAKDMLLKTVSLDPGHKNAYNLLAYTYGRLDSLEQSIAAINEYIALAPDEPNPYDTRGDLYAYAGQAELAIASYRKALSIKPDFLGRPKLGSLYAYLGRFAEADSIFRAAMSSNDPSMRSLGRLGLALTPLYQGDFPTARALLEDGVSADRLEGIRAEGFIVKLAAQAFLLRLEGRLAEALVAGKHLSELHHQFFSEDRVYWRDFLVELYAEMGQFQLADSLVSAIENDSRSQEAADSRAWAMMAQGFAAYWKGDYGVAIEAFEQADSLLDDSYTALWLARAYIEDDQLDKAIRRLETRLKSCDEFLTRDPFSSVTMHYYLAQAYEKSGWNQKAAEEYEKFLGIWHKADPNLPIIADARSRLMRLRS